MSSSSKNSNLLNNFFDILYGALLHDIGKFFWRADKTQPSQFAQLSEQELGRSGAHSKWSVAFFSKLLKGHLFEKVHEDVIENLILFHHNPEYTDVKLESISLDDYKKLVKIVQIADHASSGERIKREDEEGHGSTLTDVLQCIFSSVKLNFSFDREGYYALQSLDTSKNPRDALFPKKTKTQAYGKYAADTQKSYQELYNQFTRELQNIININKKITFSTLYYLFFKYLINIPSATFVDVPDISLFDHMKSTAAIAVCLYKDLILESNSSIEHINNSDVLDSKKKRYLLVEGNISGIQNFIYSIASKGAAKGLKGRSFFVQYVGELISQYILDRLGLPVCCEIYCDGGNFYLLLPAHMKNDLEEISLEIKNVLLNVFKGDLYIDIDGILFNRLNFSIDPQIEGEISFRDVWSQVNALVGKKKFQRFNDMFSQPQGYQNIFAPQGLGGIEDRICSICKIEKKEAEITNKEEQKCLLCENFEDLTCKIAKAQFLALAYLKDKDLEKSIVINNINNFSAVFKSNVQFLADKDELISCITKINNTKNEFEKIEIFLINNTNLEELSQYFRSLDSNGLEISFGFKFISNQIPSEIKNINGIGIEKVKDFDQIAEDDRTTGAKMLGLLRMDVDNLGSIFSEGLKVSSLSRLSTLSFRLKMFFKYWVNEICKGNIKLEDLADSEYFEGIDKIRAKNKEFLKTYPDSIKNNIYLIYSSGDDLFLIGHWNDIIVLSEVIREAFVQYTLGNPNITISAGISIVNPRFPLYQAANLTGDAEEKAKSNKDKDSICVLGEVYEWKDFKVLSLLKEKLYDYYNYKDLKKAFFHKLLQFNADYREVYRKAYRSLKSTDKALVQNRAKINLYYNVENDPIKTAHEAAYYSKWYWNFIYYMKRTIKNNKNLTEQLEELEKEIVQGQKIKDLYIPVRWAELLTKERSLE